MHDNSHETGFPDDRTIVAPPEYSFEQPRLKRFDLRTWIAQTGDFQLHILADQQPGSARQSQQRDIPRSQVLAQFAGPNAEARLVQFVQQFAMDKMDLPKVCSAGAAAHARQMLDRCSSMRIARYAYAGNQLHGLTGCLGKAMLPIGSEMDNQPHFNQPRGTPGSFLAVLIVKLVFTLATFGAGVSLLVRNSWKLCKSWLTIFRIKSISPLSM